MEDGIDLWEERNTPTSVGKTCGGNFHAHCHWKHPHERGEDTRVKLTGIDRLETPPRAWGRHKKSVAARRRSRNTPTSVGKTPSPSSMGRIYEKHPHERGEDLESRG